MIGILGQARQFGKMRKLLDEMKTVHCKPKLVLVVNLENLSELMTSQAIVAFFAIGRSKRVP
jgi:pentatricopeptide repeat protein